VAWGLAEPEVQITRVGVEMNKGVATADTFIQFPFLLVGLIGMLTHGKGFRGGWAEICLLCVAGITLQWPLGWLFVVEKASSVSTEWKLPRMTLTIHYIVGVPISALGLSYVIYAAVRSKASHVVFAKKTRIQCEITGHRYLHDPEVWLTLVACALLVLQAGLNIILCFFPGNLLTDSTGLTRIGYAYIYGHAMVWMFVFTPMALVGLTVAELRRNNAWWRVLLTPVAGVAIYYPVAQMDGLRRAKWIEGFDVHRFMRVDVWAGLVIAEIWGVFWIALQLERSLRVTFQEREELEKRLPLIAK